MLTYPEIDPILFDLGPIQIRWYGVMYVVGFLIAFLVIKNMFRNRKISLTSDQLYDLMFYGILGVLMGGRMGYILFYNLGYYLNNPFDFIKVWQGGMSFHGGLICVILFGYLYCKKHQLDFYKIADVIVIPAALALAFGRVGNFINGELYGRVTEMPFGMQFPGVEGYRHPSQLYQVLSNLIIFGILFLLRNKKLPKGNIFWLYIFLMGFFRFVIEFFRAPDIQIGLIFGVLSMGQILSIPLILIAGYYLRGIRRGWRNLRD